MHDTAYEATQAVGEAAVARGLEGLLVPSAALMGDNLISFPDNLRLGLRSRTRIEVESSQDPRLYVERP